MRYAVATHHGDPDAHRPTRHLLHHHATYNRRRLFQVEANALLLIDTLQHYRREGNYKLHAFVVMPDHIHLLLTPEAITLERAVGLIKGGFSRRLASKLPVWQRSFTDHRIRDAEDLAIRRNYINENPVRAHLCEAAEAYPFSSAAIVSHPAILDKSSPQNTSLAKPPHHPDIPKNTVVYHQLPCYEYFA